jgi:hypothetical protein
MTAPEQPTPEPVRQLMRGLTALRLEVASEIVDDLTALAQAALTAVAAQRAAEAVETTDIGELLDSPPPPNEALTRLLTSPSPWGEQDREIAEIQEEHGAQWRLKHRWIIVDNGDGSFTVHEHSGDSVWPSTDYPNKRLAAARLLQLLGIGPVAPQAHPESVCIELPGEGTAADTSATPPPGDAGEWARFIIARAVAKTMHSIPDGVAPVYKTLRPILREDIAAALQSERTAAASQARRETLPLVDAALDWLSAADALTAAKGDRLPANKRLTEAHIALRKAAQEYRALATPQERREMGRDDDAV